jgi:hypothetical protein
MSLRFKKKFSAGSSPEDIGPIYRTIISWSSTDIRCPMTAMIRISVDSFRKTNEFSGKITAIFRENYSSIGHQSMYAPNLRVSQPEKGI